MARLAGNRSRKSNCNASEETKLNRWSGKASKEVLGGSLRSAAKEPDGAYEALVELDRCLVAARTDAHLSFSFAQAANVTQVFHRIRARLRCFQLATQHSRALQSSTRLHEFGRDSWSSLL